MNRQEIYQFIRQQLWAEVYDVCASPVARNFEPQGDGLLWIAPAGSDPALTTNEQREAIFFTEGFPEGYASTQEMLRAYQDKWNDLPQLAWASLRETKTWPYMDALLQQQAKKSGEWLWDVPLEPLPSLSLRTVMAHWPENKPLTTAWRQAIQHVIGGSSNAVAVSCLPGTGETDFVQDISLILVLSVAFSSNANLSHFDFAPRVMVVTPRPTYWMERLTHDDESWASRTTSVVRPSFSLGDVPAADRIRRLVSTYRQGVEKTCDMDARQKRSGGEMSLNFSVEQQRDVMNRRERALRMIQQITALWSAHQRRSAWWSYLGSVIPSVQQWKVQRNQQFFQKLGYIPSAIVEFDDESHVSTVLANMESAIENLLTAAKSEYKLRVQDQQELQQTEKKIKEFRQSAFWALPPIGTAMMSIWNEDRDQFERAEIGKGLRLLRQAYWSAKNERFLKPVIQVVTPDEAVASKDFPILMVIDGDGIPDWKLLPLMGKSQKTMVLHPSVEQSGLKVSNLEKDRVDFPLSMTNLYNYYCEHAGRAFKLADESSYEKAPVFWTPVTQWPGHEDVEFPARAFLEDTKAKQRFLDAVYTLPGQIIPEALRSRAGGVCIRMGLDEPLLVKNAVFYAPDLDNSGDLRQIIKHLPYVQGEAWIVTWDSPFMMLEAPAFFDFAHIFRLTTPTNRRGDFVAHQMSTHEGLKALRGESVDMMIFSEEGLSDEVMKDLLHVEQAAIRFNHITLRNSKLMVAARKNRRVAGNYLVTPTRILEVFDDRAILYSEFKTDVGGALVRKLYDPT